MSANEVRSKRGPECCKEEANWDGSLGINSLRFPLVFEVTIDPVLSILALLAFAPLLLFLSLFSPVAHYNYLFF